MPATRERHPYDAAAALVAGDLDAVDRRLEELVRSQRDYLTDVEVAFYRAGKRVRPLLLLLSAHAAARRPLAAVPDKGVVAAVALEIMHVGSLIHDDIVDRAPTRRGLPTISASRGYELALVVGDLQWAQAARLAARCIETRDDVALLHRFLEACEQTCRGQLDEMLASDGAGDLFRRYFRTVDRKTGQMFAFACESGARVVDGTPDVVGGLRRFGTWFGRAFQVVDDVLDVVRPGAASGKDALTDLHRGRLSLPLLYTLDALPRDHPLWGLVDGTPLTDAQLADGARLLRHGDGWMRALGDARAIVARAGSELDLLPSGPHREALRALVAHLVDQGFGESHGVVRRAS